MEKMKKGTNNRASVMPPNTDEYIRAAVTVCRPDFIMADEQDHVVHCVRFNSRARVVFEGIEPSRIWEAIVRDREQYPGEWEAWRSYWNTGARS